MFHWALTTPDGGTASVSTHLCMSILQYCRLGHKGDGLYRDFGGICCGSGTCMASLRQGRLELSLAFPRIDSYETRQDTAARAAFRH